MIHKAKITGITQTKNAFLRAFRFIRAFGEEFRFGKQYHVPGVDSNPSKNTTRGLCIALGGDASQMVVPLFLDDVDKIADEGEFRCYSTSDGKTVNYYVFVKKTGVELNGSQFGGLIKIEELTTKLNELITAYNAHTHVGAGAISATHPDFVQTDYENTGVKHG